MSSKSNYTLYLRNKVWYYRTYRNGERTSGLSTHETSKKKARLYCEALIANQMLSGSALIFGSYATNWFIPGKCQWVADRMACGVKGTKAISKNYILSLQKLLRLYILPFFSKLQLREIKSSDIKKFRIELQKKELSNRTINLATDALHIMIKWALADRLIGHDPFFMVKRLQVEAKMRQSFTIEQVIKILERKKWTDKTAWLFTLTAAVTGMRLSEIRGIRCDNLCVKYIDLKDQFLTDDLSPLKTKISRKVPIPDILYKLLSDELKGEKRFVFALPGEILPEERYRIIRAFDRAMPEGLDRQAERLSFHSLRHFFCTYMIAENVPPHKVRAAMGHSGGTGTMTETYTSWEPEMYPEIYAAQEKMINLIFASNQKLKTAINF